MDQHCGPTAAVAVVSHDPTYAPQTPATSPENNCQIHLTGLPQARISYGGMCLGRGHMSIRYDTRCYFNLHSKANISQLNLPHGTNN